MKKFLAYEYTDTREYIEDFADGTTEYYTDVITTYYYIRLLNEVPSFAKVVDDKLHLGDIVVDDYSYYGDLNGEIPKLYTIRVKHEDNDYFSFESGFDLLDDGRVWVGHINVRGDKPISSEYFDTMESAIEHINSHINLEWILTLEEPMP